MLEISPVLAGAFNSAGYTPAATNINQSADSSSSSDNVRKTTDAGEITDLSFGDVLDTINPLQHIPIVSSIYRAVTGEQIRPVARVVGDIIYGAGIGGGIGGGISAVSDSVANSIMEAETGKDVGATIIASLFGSDSANPTTQMAQNQPSQVEGNNTQTNPTDPTTTSVAAAQAATLATAPVTSVTSQNAQTATTVTGLSAPSAIPLPTQKSYALNTNKQPYGGVIDLSGTRGEQELATTLAANSNGAQVARIGSTIYTGRFPNHAMPLAPVGASTQSSQTNQSSTSSLPPSASASPTNSQASASSTAQDTDKTGPQRNPLPPELVNDMMLQALSKYKNTALGPTNSGSVLDITN